ncbi:MAG TPA: efflux RND transporter periplasmic adaptor subunit [Blastocatellia bacterium]|nr:efflux RND transporter periplasmic adaptor subunit [Blastocatellia bacterium]
MDRIRSDLIIIRQVQRGDVTYVVKDPVALQYYRFGPLEHTVIKYLDGSHDHDQIAEALATETGVRLTGSMIAEFVESLNNKALIERSVGEKSLVLLERLRKERKLKADTDSRDILYMRFPFFDPDQFYDRLIRHIGFFWSRPFVICCFVLFSMAAIIIISNWGVISAGLNQLYAFQDKGASDIVMFIAVLFIIIVFHENGHGLTCKRYGGEVHELGFMFIYFMPAFYANVTDAWTFNSKAAKLWVTFAGAFVELIICSIASFVWYFSTPGYFMHDLAFTFMLVAGLSSIIVNMNPLIKLDGYFALVDYLEIPNLSDESSKYIGALARKYIFRAPAVIPDYPPRRKRILFTYGALAFCYRILILVVVMLFFNRHINELFPEAGVFIFPLVAYRLLRKKLKSAWKGIRFLLIDKREVLMKPKSLAITGATLAVAGGLFAFFPLSYSHRTTFVIEPADRIRVRAGTEGFIGSVVVNEGDAVKRGALLAVLHDPDLEQKHDSQRSEIALLNRRILQDQAQGATAESLKGRRRREQIGNELVETESRLEQLRITAPADGVVVTRNVSDRVGQRLKQGEEFCELASLGVRRARVIVDDWDLKDIQIGARADLRLNSAPALDLSGRVAALAPASELHQRLSQVAESERVNEQAMAAVKSTPTNSGAATRLSAQEQAGAKAAAATSPFETPLTRFEVFIEVEGATIEVKPGMSGDVKIYGNKRPLAVTVWRGLRDWFRSKIWW